MKILPMQTIRVYIVRHGIDAGLVVFVKRQMPSASYGNLGRPEGYPPLPMPLSLHWKLFPDGIPEVINPDGNGYPKKYSRRFGGPSTVTYRLINYKDLGDPISISYHRMIINSTGKRKPLSHSPKTLLKDCNINTNLKAPWFASVIDQMMWVNLLQRDAME